MTNPLSAVIETTKTIPAVIGIPGPQGASGPTGATGQGVPVGGTTGQVLTKIDATNYNTQWADLIASQIPVLDAAKITTGIFDVARIPTLTLSKISDAGTMAAQNANAVAITGGTISGLTSFANNGDTTLGDAAGDVLTINGTAVTIPNGLNFDSNTLVIDAANNRVGIGASTLSAPFHIRSSAAGVPYYSQIAIEPSSNNNDSAMYLKTTRGTGREWFFGAGTGGTGDSGKFRIFDITAGQDRLNIDHSGNVIIGGTTGSSRLHVIATDAGTNNTLTVVTIVRNSSGTPAQGYASRLQWQLESSTTENTDAASRRVIWEVATHLSRRSRLLDSVYSVATETAVVGQGVDGADIADVQAFHFGRPNADGTWPDGTWRIIRSGNNLVTERRESAAWVTKQTISA